MRPLSWRLRQYAAEFLVVLIVCLRSEAHGGGRKFQAPGPVVARQQVVQLTRAFRAFPPKIEAQAGLVGWSLSCA